MAFQVSPGINISEIDITTVVPAVATSTGAIAGVFRWGPVGVLQLLGSELELVQRFGKPSNYNAETFFSAANFLAYGNSLYVSRAFDTTNMLSAVANVSAVSSMAVHVVKNHDDYTAASANFESEVLYIAKYPGALGNSIRVSVCDSTNAFSSAANLAAVGTNTSFNSVASNVAFTVGNNQAIVSLANTVALTSSTPLPHANTVHDLFNVGDIVTVGNTTIGFQDVKITSVGSIVVANSAGTNTGHASFTLTFDQKFRLSDDINLQTVTRSWEFSGKVNKTPGQTAYAVQQGATGNDELHVVVVDQLGKFSGVPGTVLEVFQGLSRATDAKTSDGASNYYKDVLNASSAYIWYSHDSSTAASAVATSVVSSTATAPISLTFQGGVDGGDESDSGIAFGDLARAWDLFASAENVDIALVIAGAARGAGNGAQLASYLIDNIAEARKDCVVFASPKKSMVVNNTFGDQASQIVGFRNNVTSTSYAVLDTGYKYQYDKYNDIYRYIPLNGDIAGVTARTDNVRDPWWSPAGFNRGQIKNIVKLAYNPSKTDRDLLYKNGINPVVTFPGQGTVLYGDKTLLANPSAFDRINVRRLFIILEKAIAVVAKSTLFEFNDEFTRAQFVSIVTPYLRDIKARRGIYDYKVVCDTSNNTGEVIDTNRFVGDIYVKPARAINYIQLNFIAVRTGVDFTEVVGKF